MYFGSSQIFLKYLHKNEKNTIVHITPDKVYYTILHVKLASVFYATQLVDIFSYELPLNKNEISFNQNASIAEQSSSIVVYNFQSIATQQRFFFFAASSPKITIRGKRTNYSALMSITELFSNANWLEREASELHGIFFSGKKDIRNLMLQYGDTSAPLKKSFPSIGIREIFYDTSSDLLIQNPVSIQF